MLNSIKKALGINEASPEQAVTARLRSELLAATLLLEAAHADYECSEEEMDHVVETVKSMFSLPDEYVEELMELAHSKRNEAVDLQQITSLVNKSMNRDEKIVLIEAVWRIMYVDGQIDKYEDHFARKLCHLLWLDHKDFIQAKLKAKPDP